MTNNPVDLRQLTFIGPDYIKEFETNDFKVKVCCKNYRSPIYIARKDSSNAMRFRLDAVETLFSCENECHIYSITYKYP